MILDERLAHFLTIPEVIPELTITGLICQNCLASKVEVIWAKMKNILSRPEEIAFLL
jgi:hypothetical protein